MSDNAKQDPRTTHLLPPANLHVSDRDWYSSPAPTPSLSGPPTVQSSKSSTSYLAAYGNNYRSYNSLVNQNYWSRYIGIFTKDGKSKFGKIITQLSLEDWAKENGYTIVKFTRLFGSINPEKEKTEFSTGTSMDDV